MKNLTSEEIMSYFTANKDIQQHFKKSGLFLYRPAAKGETVVTMLKGTVETINTAKDNDVVVRNLIVGLFGETYILPIATLEKRYELPNSVSMTEKSYLLDGYKWEPAYAKGECMAFPYDGSLGNYITFKATWGEDMICEPGDMICWPVGGAKDDIYRIEKRTFELTYKEVVKEETTD